MAGEAGRGFSVVADEIRKLSESAGSSADEIAKLIDEIQSDTSQVADQMRESSEVIDEGREDVNTIAASLSQIGTAVSEAARRSEEIFHDADSHATNAERMVVSMEAIAKGSHANARVIEDVSRTGRIQLEAVGKIVHGSDALTRLAEDLRALLRDFQTGLDTGCPDAGGEASI